MIDLVDIIMPDFDSSPELVMFLLQAAVWVLGIFCTILVGLVGYIWQIQASRIKSSCEEVSVLKEFVGHLEKDVINLKNTAISYPDAKQLFGELFATFHESQGRIETMLSNIGSEMKTYALKIAVLEDRENRRDNGKSPS